MGDRLANVPQKATEQVTLHSDRRTQWQEGHHLVRQLCQPGVASAPLKGKMNGTEQK